MLPFLSKIIAIDRIQIVGICQDTDKEKYTVLSLKKDKNELKIVNSATTETKNELLSIVDTKLPVILVVDGKGVLNKKIDFSNETDLAWQKNIDYNSIYHTSYKTDQALFISFCRKNIVEEWISYLQTAKIALIDFYIGNFPTVLLAEQINQTVILANETELEFENNLLIGFKKQLESQNKNYHLGDNTLSNYLLPLYAVGIQFFINTESISKSEFETNAGEEQIYKKIFSAIGITMLVGFLVALTASYFGIQYYSSKNAELNIQNVYSNKVYQQILELEKQKKDKEGIIRDVGLLSDKFLSFYSYELAASVPSSIALTDIDVYPVVKEVKNKEKVEIEAKTIIVKGVTVDEDDFNDWLRTIKKLEWLQKFEIEALKKDKRNNTQFTIAIWVK
ncbi:hypothetical protein DI487_15885 [Flavobacterium sediminis]|uniref:General secretion pathway protein n=1 Tax=Flavobacterium sediminis TaxID=2201181 RepID=A0A2U8QYQ3_9FLAO|nr:hypothetical protein DI487_15885 [Flavobacterium sediminis]